MCRFLDFSLAPEPPEEGGDLGGGRGRRGHHAPQLVGCLLQPGYVAVPKCFRYLGQAAGREGLEMPAHLPQGRQGGPAVTGYAETMTPSWQQVFQDRLIVRVVFGEQDVQPP